MQTRREVQQHGDKGPPKPTKLAADMQRMLTDLKPDPSRVVAALADWVSKRTPKDRAGKDRDQEQRAVAG
jgi:hypothetical protein